MCLIQNQPGTYRNLLSKYQEGNPTGMSLRGQNTFELLDMQSTKRITEHVMSRHDHNHSHLYISVHYGLRVC